MEPGLRPRSDEASRRHLGSRRPMPVWSARWGARPREETDKMDEQLRRGPQGLGAALRRPRRSVFDGRTPSIGFRRPSQSCGHIPLPALQSNPQRIPEPTAFRRQTDPRRMWITEPGVGRRSNSVHAREAAAPYPRNRADEVLIETLSGAQHRQTPKLNEWRGRDGICIRKVRTR